MKAAGRGALNYLSVMAGEKREAVFALDVPGIHVFLSCWAKDVDGRDKHGHDGVSVMRGRLQLQP